MTGNHAPGDQATVTVALAVTPARAFELFTEDIDIWWRRGPRFRSSASVRGMLFIEPGPGGRIFESEGDGAHETVFEIGRVSVWEPPHRLVFSWRAVNFAPDEATEVEALFEPGASGGTRLTVTHRGWSRIRLDHPVRHGHAEAKFIRVTALWWADLMTALREYATRAPL
ncbi:MAG: SRPBCC domain-containing protein [Proteobacteria bacterium]|nr:SRPBCC domain-containing protein [Pseudomonadota bacterium]